MRKIRIGKDIAVKWTVKTNGENISFEGRDITLVVNSPLGAKYQQEFEYEGNTLQFVFRGKNHKSVGVHTLTLWENYGKDGQTVLDNDDFVCLVKSTSEED